MKESKRRLIFAILIFILGEIAIVFLDQLILNNRFILDRFILLSFVPFLVFFLIAFKMNCTFNFMFRKRYWIGFILLIYVVGSGYHGSSISIYEHVIQPSLVNEENFPFIGEYRDIRSDEFLVDTPAVLSQLASNTSLTKYNDSIMAKETLVTLFPALPTKSLAILLKPHMIGYLFLPLENAFSFAWVFPYFALFFGLFELFRKITNDKRGYSLFGAMLLTLSPAIQWWGIPQIFIYGIFATVFFSLFLDSKNNKARFVYSILIGWMGACYIATVYPAWMIPYGFFFLALFIWLWVTCKKERRWINKYFYYLIPIMLVILALIVPVLLENIPVIELTSKTVYPGARSSSGGSAWEWLYHYIPSILYPFKRVSNASEFSQIISLYPLPILLGLYYSYKNYKAKRRDLLLTSLLIVTIGLTIWNYIDIGIFSKLTLLSMSTPSRTQLIASVSCAFLLIVILSNYSEKNNCKDIKKISVCTVLSGIFLYVGMKACIHYLPDYMNMKVMLISGSVFSVLFFLFLMNNKKTNYIFVGLVSAILIVQGLTINPITKGVGALYDKPLFNEIRELVEKNPDSKWITADAPLHTQSAVLANGAKVLNSTNYHPNFDFWYKIDPKKENEDIYNRYSHVIINLVHKETSFHLVSPDCVQISMDYKDIKKLGVDYIVSTSDSYANLSQGDLYFEMVYGEDGFFIYRITTNRGGI